jgi:uncharacterized protein (TIGR02598 family)
MKECRRFRCAFTLVEVVVALGVATFAILAILGIIPLALSSNRSGMNEARAAQLVRAITGTIDSQCGTFAAIDCYGDTLDLTALKKGDAPQTLYASYASPNQPAISTSSADAVCSIEMRFDNDPPISSAPLGPGKVNLIEIRVFGKDRSEGSMEFFYLARNKG